MAKSKKIISQDDTPLKKQVVTKGTGTANKNTIWVFDLLDVDEKFAFNLDRKDFDHREFLEKMIAYSNMTWSDISRQTHDCRKSKHHYLIRIVGIRDGEFFHVVWYDPKHEFYPTKRQKSH